MTGPITTPESVPYRPLKIEVVDALGVENAFVLNQELGTVANEEGAVADLTSYETSMLGLLMNKEDYPFKLNDVRLAVSSVPESDDVMPSTAVVSILQKAPFLIGHVVGVVEGKTQFYSFLSTAHETKIFTENLKTRLKNERADKKTHKDLARRHERIINVAEAALASAVVVGSVIGYRKHKRTNKGD